jgi:hypothetical protein
MIRNCAYDCLNRLLLYLQLALRKSACMCELQKIIFPLAQNEALYTVFFLLTSGRQPVEKLGKPVEKLGNPVLFLFQSKRYIYSTHQLVQQCNITSTCP